MKHSIAIRRRARAAFTMVELAVAGTILAVVLMSILVVATRDDALSRSSLSVGVAETRAQEMLAVLERELVHARGASPRAALTQTLGTGETGAIVVDSTLGFPDQGTLLIDRGSGSVERVRYTSLDATRTRFLGLERGVNCTTATTHAQGATVLWSGLAEPIAIQSNPGTSLFDGRATESTGPVFYRGEGAGFSYRVPTDPTGGTDYMDGSDVRWGAVVGNTPTLDGWAAVYYEPRETFDESTARFDLNKDGDTSDTFDVGQIRKRSWDTANPNAQVRELGLGPTVVVQERCRYGSDLDGDGASDPLFLWDANLRRLHVRLFVLGSGSSSTPILRKVETTLFLRNEPEG